MIRAPTSGIRCSGTTRVSPKRSLKRRAISRISSTCWRWSSPTGTSVAPVGEHVGGHQHRVEEERRRDQLALLRRLLLELVHAVEVAVGGDRREQPGQLGVLADVGLAEEDAALGVEAGGEQDRGRVVEALAQLGRVVGDRDRVQVDDAEDRRVAAVLALDVLADRADVVAEVLAAGRLDAGEDARCMRRSLCGRRAQAASAVGLRSRPPASSQSASAQWPHSPAAAAPRVGIARSSRFGFSIPSPATMPPTIIRTPAMPIPRWKAEVEASVGSRRRSAPPRRRQPTGVRHGAAAFPWRRRPPAAPGGERRAAELARRACEPKLAEITAPRTAIASRPATRETPLLTPEAMPTWRSSTESSTVAVSGATVAERPRPKTSRPGSTSVT